MSVAEYISLQLEACGKAQREVAEQAGFEKPNMITMIKQGKTKLPLAKVGPMARALGVDPIYLFQLAMSEYLPETWEAIEALRDQPLLTENELEVVGAMRSANLGTKKLTGDQRRDLVKWLKTELPKDA
jgi:transcriptional regulator with XRE-family HTH domain